MKELIEKELLKAKEEKIQFAAQMGYLNGVIHALENLLLGKEIIKEKPKDGKE